MVIYALTVYMRSAAANLICASFIRRKCIRACQPRHVFCNSVARSWSLSRLSSSRWNNWTQFAQYMIICNVNIWVFLMLNYVNVYKGSVDLHANLVMSFEAMWQDHEVVSSWILKFVQLQTKLIIDFCPHDDHFILKGIELYDNPFW